MKIGINSIKQIYEQAGVVQFLPDDINAIAERIGAQLGEIEQIKDLGKKYKGIVAVKVVSCIDHPNADKLKLCKVDDGGKIKSVERDADGLVQVVCGAPNVKAGILAAWIPPAVAVPATLDKEPFVLEAREIRGQISNGMLASPSELDLNDDHDGILEIDKQAEPGEPFAPIYKLDTYIIDIENKMFTHRPDCFGLLGIARELAGIYHKPFKSPAWYIEIPEFPKPQSDLKLEVINEIPGLAPRFCAVAIADVKVGPSPLWLQVMLSKFGIKSINNIVDLTNFYMLFSGQPLHAYDYDKVTGLSGQNALIKVRQAAKGEKLKLLNGKEAVMNGTEIMIATDKHPVGIGGVIGGMDTEVDLSTKNIILECANFDAYSIRRTSMAHGIFTDAVTRFTKGQSPRQNLAVLAKITGDIINFNGGKLAGKVFDLKGKIATDKPVIVSTGFINERLGLELSIDEISKLLENVEFKVNKSGDSLNIKVPFWRTDIEIPEDVVEEVGRLYGYDHLALELPERTISPAVISDDLTLKDKLRRALSASGANEVLSYSFVNGALLEQVGQDTAKSYKLKNALSPKLQYYRQSLTPSLLEKVHPNIKAGFDEFALFELGKVHIKGNESGGLPDEFGRVALITAAKTKKSGQAFYTARKYLIEMLELLGITEKDIIFEPLAKSDDPASVYYLQGRAATIKVDGEIIGRIGEYDQKVTAKLKLPDFCAGFELELATLLKFSGRDNNYSPLSRYPLTEQDICLRTKIELDYADIRKALEKALDDNSPTDVNIKISCIDIFSKDGFKQTTFRISASSYERTLTSEIINLLFEKAASELKKSIGADIV